jgi:hypothetical protein
MAKGIRLPDCLKRIQRFQSGEMIGWVFWNTAPQYLNDEDLPSMINDHYQFNGNVGISFLTDNLWNWLQNVENMGMYVIEYNIPGRITG